jgi:hypothetical protein
MRANSYRVLPKLPQHWNVEHMLSDQTRVALHG